MAVQIRLRPVFGCCGARLKLQVLKVPRCDICSYGAQLSGARLAQLVERKALNLVVVGSSPTVGDLLVLFIYKSRALRFSSERRSPCACLQGRVAQWIRRRSSEPKIVGSSPTVVIHFHAGVGRIEN